MEYHIRKWPKIVNFTAVLFPYLSADDLLTFSRTCKTLKSTTCPIFKHFRNLRILENPTYAKAAEILQSTYKDGWLVPCRSEILRVRERQREKAEDIEGTAFRLLRKLIRSLPPRSDFDYLIALSNPGPQYLLFLEFYSYCIISNDAFARRIREERGRWSTSFEGWDDGVAMYAGWFFEWLEECECRWEGEIEGALVKKGKRFGEGFWAVGALLAKQWPLR